MDPRIVSAAQAKGMTPEAFLASLNQTAEQWLAANPLPAPGPFMVNAEQLQAAISACNAAEAVAKAKTAEAQAAIDAAPGFWTKAAFGGGGLVIGSGLGVTAGYFLFRPTT